MATLFFPSIQPKIMDFLERDLEDIIIKSSSIELQKCRLDISRFKKQQVRIGNYGVADIVSVNKEVYLDPDGKVRHYEKSINVYELKKDKVNDKAITQVIRYMRGISRWLEYTGKQDWKINGIVIGRSIQHTSDLLYLTDMMGFHFDLEMYSYSYDINGLRFTNEYGYSLTNEGWNE